MGFDEINLYLVLTGLAVAAGLAAWHGLRAGHRGS